MTKTEARNLVREIRMEASAIKNAVDRPEQFSSPEAMGEWIENRLNNIDGFSAQLREAYAPDSY